MKGRGARRVVALTLVLCLAGCVVQRRVRSFPSDSKLAENEASRVLMGKKCGDIRLVSINGQDGPNGHYFGFSSTWDGGFDILLKPGDYKLGFYRFEKTVVIRFEDRTFVSSPKGRDYVGLTLEPGHKYEACEEHRGGDVGVALKDLATGGVTRSGK
jgi:hypothetical protein